MNKILFGVASLLLLTRSASADETSPQPKELVDLRAKYVAEIQDATKPVKDRYRDNLKELLQAELAKGDLDGIAAIRKELQTLRIGYPFSGRWSTRKASSIIEFHPDGKWIESWNGTTQHGEWKPDGDFHVTVIDKDSPDGRIVLHYFLNHEGHLIRELGNSDYELKDLLDE
jgi:hypothetical protein